MRSPALCVLAVLLAWGSTAHAVVVIDADVEDDGDWTTFGVVWTSDTTFITPGFQEGSEAADLDNLPSFPNTISRTFTGIPLEPGTYTVEFAVGAASGGMFPTSATQFEFSGMGVDEASSANTPPPATGTWELWTVVWEIDACHSDLGSDLTWHFEVGNHPASPRPARFDGVGSLSPTGDGFVVSYEPPGPKGDYALFGQAEVAYPGNSPVVLDAIRGSASIDDPGTGSPVLTKLAMQICWDHVFESTVTSLIPGTTLVMDVDQRLRPDLPQVGTGSTQTSISWGSLTGWTQTGWLYCKSHCPGGCGASSGCTPFFGFEGTGPPIPLSSTSFDTDPWEFITYSNSGIMFGAGSFVISDEEPVADVKFTQELHMIGVRPGVVAFGSAYCVMGPSGGSDWSWQLDDQGNTWSDPAVTNTASTGQELASLFAASINAQASPTVTATLLTTWPCFQLNGGSPPFTLQVGEANQPVNCAITNFSGCPFNPTLAPLPLFAVVPAAPAWALGALALGLAALGYHRLRARRARKA